MNLLPFFIFSVIGLGIGVVLLTLSNIFGTKHAGIRKHDIYESGMDPVGSATRRYDIKFFLTAILFLLFDVEIVFLFPWALSFSQSKIKTIMIAEFLFFMAIFLVGYLFVLFSKSLDWEE